MSAARLASRYAKSIIDLSMEKGKLETVSKDMELFNVILKGSREFLVMLKSPIINADQKMAVLEKAFKGKIDQLTFEFLRILVTKGREGYFPEIAKSFVEQHNKHKNISPVRLTTAVAIDDSIKTQIIKSLHEDDTVGKVELESVVDSKLIGGFVLQYQDKRYDASVIRSLNELRHKVEDSSYRPRI